jgi:hypothetical protein
VSGHGPDSGEDSEASGARASSRGKGSGELTLDFPRGRAARLAVFGAALGFPGLGAWLALLATGLLAGSLSGTAQVAVFALFALLALAASTLLPPALLRARQPRPARVTWDREGLVERDGAHVRTAIPWLGAQARVAHGERGRVVQVSDAEGRAITLAEPRAAPRWLAHRKACAADLGLLAGVLGEVDPGPEIAPDARDARRPTMGWQATLLTLAVGLVALPMMALVPDLRRVGPAFAALLVCILSAAPALRPLHELLELLAWQRLFERSEPATIEEGEGREALLRRADGTRVRIDLGPARHPDAWLATREGAQLFVVLPLAGWIPAVSRLDLGPPVEVTQVETEHERQARGETLRAAAIELSARAAAVLWWGAASLSPLWW